MLNDKERADIDQGIAMLSEFYPAQWRSMYNGLIKHEFTEAQAMELLKTYIATTCKPSA